MKPNDFFDDKIFKATWLTDSINQGDLIDINENSYEVDTKTLQLKNTSSCKNKSISFNPRQAYTIAEAIKIQRLAETDGKGRCRGATYWKEVEQNKRIPNRSAESMRNFYKKELKFGLEPFLKTYLKEYKYNFSL
jgi:hypothetical protein